ncbi:hypothetical protein DXG01_007340 [Tephrocybe rancida]|nr:hypothetical protein DXG01_007340 [Tephrocybe rancida]
MASQSKDSNRVAGGLKATIKNPRVSDEAKSSAQDRLHDMESSEAPSSRSKKGTSEIVDDDDEFSSNASSELSQQQLGGYKATLKNPNVSEGAKHHAEEILEEHGQA